MVIYPAGRVQLSFNERKNSNDEILERSLLINIRSQNADDAVELYHELKRKLEGNTGHLEKPLVVFEDQPEDKRMCPDCKIPLRVRVGRNGPFYGCTRYPQCHHTERA